MDHKVSVTIERNGKRYYASCPELPNCRAEGESIEDTLAKMREVIVRFLQRLKRDEIKKLMSNEIYTTTLSIEFD